VNAGYFDNRYAVVGQNGSIFTSSDGISDWSEMGCMGLCFPFIGILSSDFNGVPFSMIINSISSEIWVKS